MTDLLEQALNLPPTERIRLADKLYRSVEGTRDAGPLTDAQKEELQRRLEDLEKNPGGNFSWKEVKAEALARK